MTDAELAILSIIAEGPIYGYDIQTIITQRGLRAWTNIGVSSMYYVLEKLERQGLIESKGAQHLEGAARRQYRITPAGFGVLQTAVADLLSTPREHANDFELGLANLYVLRPTQIRTAFITYRQELVSRLAQARERWRKLKDSGPPLNVDAMLGHHVALLEAELAWIKDFIEEWEAQAPPDESPALPPEPAEVPRMKQVILPHDPDSPHRVPTRSLDRQLSQKPRTEADTDLNLSSMPGQTPPGNRIPSHPDAPSESERKADPGDEHTSEEDPDRPDEP